MAEDIVNLRELNTQNEESEGGVEKGEYEQWRRLQREGRGTAMARIMVDKARKKQNKESGRNKGRAKRSKVGRMGDEARKEGQSTVA